MPRPIESLSGSQARRIALAAQGFGTARPSSVPNGRHVRALFARLNVVQIDSVNVLVRSHYLPLFSRLGPYRRELLERAAYDPKRRELFEYWGHEASLLPLAMQPLLRWRMARARDGREMWGGIARVAAEHPEFVQATLAAVRERGPLGAGDLERNGRSGWWGWSKTKAVLEYLFWAGFVTTAYRRSFERVYDLVERTLPAAVLALPTPPEDAAQRELLMIAAGALGVGTERDLRDYFRIPAADARTRVAELIEAGRLLPVRVEGWRQSAYLTGNVRIPRRIDARALLSPFDSLVWERSRTHALFDFHYRLEIYTPAHKRIHGYYVLPFLLGDRLVARVDLKADRAKATLLVQNVHFEPDVDRAAVIDELDEELAALASWLNLGEAVYVRRPE
ncbi:MAG: winged helix-turn-helix domain-containing protein [Candidatus Baltobacteraceae bacterium]